MLEAFSTTCNRRIAFVFLAIFCVSAAIATVLGISDNPPGIFLAYGSITALILAFVHPWRTLKPFRNLFFAAVLGFVIFGILHNVFEAVASRAITSGVLQSLMQVLGVASFLVGAIGSVITFIRNRTGSTAESDTAV
jgi:hypothetical protein